MTDLYLVFSLPTERVADEEFVGWYDRHIPEILETPGFLSAKLVRLTPVMFGSEEEAAFRYLVVYETEGDIARAPGRAQPARVSRGRSSCPSGSARRGT